VPPEDKKNYWSPYIAGVGIGLTLLAAFFFAGRGLGASSAFARGAAAVANSTNPRYAAGLAYFSDYLREGSPFRDWIVFEVAGLFLGALTSALFTRSFSLRFDRGKGAGRFARFLGAFTGGLLIGFSSRLARGCTSGVGLSGAGQLALSGWIFLLSLFVSGLLTAFIARRGLWG